MALKMITITLTGEAREDMFELAKWLQEHGYGWPDPTEGMWVVSKNELHAVFVGEGTQAKGY